MPEATPDPAGQHDGAEGTVVEGGHGRGSLDVSEWVSELRRLYVEPKTRAARRQEGAIAPQKRKLGRTRGRGSDRAADPAPGPAADTTEPPDVVAVQKPTATKTVLPTRPAAIDPTPVVDESEDGYTPPGAEATGDAPAAGPADADHEHAGNTSRSLAELAGLPDQRPEPSRTLVNDSDVEAEADDTQGETLQSPDAPWTRASARAASVHQSERRRRSVVVGLVLAALAIAAWYLFLRG